MLAGRIRTEAVRKQEQAEETLTTIRFQLWCVEKYCFFSIL